MRTVIPDADAMHDFGATLAGRLRAGDLVVLTGPLGAGSTRIAPSRHASECGCRFGTPMICAPPKRGLTRRRNAVACHSRGPFKIGDASPGEGTS